MGRTEKIVVGCIAAMYAGLLGLLLVYGHGSAAVLAMLVILVKAAMYFGFIRHAASMGLGARRRPINPTALLQGRST